MKRVSADRRIGFEKVKKCMAFFEEIAIYRARGALSRQGGPPEAVAFSSILE